MAEYPEVFRVRQHFDVPQVDDVAAAVESQLAGLSLDNQVKQGQTVAVAVGSRGISNIHHIVKAIVSHLKQLGAEPFIVPAMGSHGGGRAEGQHQLLGSIGVTEQFCE